jgi:hypothetical protein
MSVRLATIPSVDRRPLGLVRTMLADSDRQPLDPVWWRVPRDRPLLRCRWRIDPTGKLACGWSLIEQAPTPRAEAVPHIGSPPIQPQAAVFIDDVVSSAFVTQGIDHGRGT